MSSTAAKAPIVTAKDLSPGEKSTETSLPNVPKVDSDKGTTKHRRTSGKQMVQARRSGAEIGQNQNGHQEDLSKHSLPPKISRPKISQQAKNICQYIREKASPAERLLIRKVLRECWADNSARTLYLKFYKADNKYRIVEQWTENGKRKTKLLKDNFYLDYDFSQVRLSKPLQKYLSNKGITGFSHESKKT